MPPLLRFIIYRLLSIPLTLVVITMTLYGFVMLTPPEVRASLYFPEGFNPDRLTPESLDRYVNTLIEQRHLNDPYVVQYGLWVSNLARGNWGWSPVLDENVLAALLRRTPVTVELTLYSLLLIIPLGIIAGVIAGSKKNRLADHRFRSAAFLATSMPPFVLAIFLMAIFYVMLHWFPPGRISTVTNLDLRPPEFIAYTGLLTVDGMLNNRWDVALEALRHLVLPVLTLSLVHWATLARITRATMIEELQKDYVLAGRAHGLPERRVVWRHALRNTLSPALTNTGLAAASLFTGVFVVEVIFNFRGVSDLILYSLRGDPDAPTILGFAVYSVLMVLAIMFVLDLLQALLDPRVRSGVLTGGPGE